MKIFENNLKKISLDNEIEIFENLKKQIVEYMN